MTPVDSEGTLVARRPRGDDTLVIQPRRASDRTAQASDTGAAALRGGTVTARRGVGADAVVATMGFAGGASATIIQARANSHDASGESGTVAGWTRALLSRKVVTWGIIGSVAVHLMFGVFSAEYANRWLLVAAAKPPEPEVTLLYPDAVQAEEPPAPEKKKPDRYVRTTQNDAADAPPEKADFISDKNTVASSKNAPDPDGDKALPSMKGTDLPGLELAKRDYKDGEIRNDSAVSPPPNMAAPAPPPTPDTPPAKPEPRQPEPGTPKPLMATKEDAPSEKPPQEAAAASQPKADQPPERSKPAPPAAPPVANAPNAAPDAFMPETRRSEVKGGLTRRGEQDAVNAVRTIAGVYNRSVQDAIGKRWRRELGLTTMHMLPGRITLHFLVGRDGTVREEDVSVLLDEASPMLKQTALNAICSTPLPAIPGELVPLLNGAGFPVNLNFVFH